MYMLSLILVSIFIIWPQTYALKIAAGFVVVYILYYAFSIITTIVFFFLACVAFYSIFIVVRYREILHRDDALQILTWFIITNIYSYTIQLRDVVLTLLFYYIKS